MESITAFVVFTGHLKQRGLILKPCEKKNCDCGCTGKVVFSDRVMIGADKTVFSVRDGVYEYLGLECGVEPAHQIFTVYRSPQSVRKAALLMNGIPVTDGHVSTDYPPSEVLATVEGAEVVPFEDESVDSTIVVKNKFATSDDVLQLIQSGKNELSLGFKAKLTKHDVYDFEQSEFEPHHLAILDRGRCGTACRFIDRKPDKENLNMPKLEKLQKILLSFIDQDGEMTLQQLMEMVAALPEAIRSVPMEELQKLAPALKEIIEVAQAAGVEIVEPVEEKPEETTDQESTEEEKDKQEGKDTEEEVDGKDKEPSDDEKLAMADGKILFSDAQVKQLFVDHSAVVERARQFVDEAFDFTGKTTLQIQRAVLDKFTDQKFTDAEVATAFKLLKPGQSMYNDFADKEASDKLDEISEKEL